MRMISTGGRGQQLDFTLFGRDGVYDYTSQIGDYFRAQIITIPTQEVRVYILAHPRYPQGRSDAPDVTHRRFDQQRQRYYVAFETATPPADHAQACKWLVMWAEGTSRYLRTGQFAPAEKYGDT